METEQGLLHLYWGDGKGKTTAAMGLALRALGQGKRVVIVQFLKGGSSGEIPLLEQLGAKIYRGKAGQKFVFQMNEAEKAAAREVQNANLAAAKAEPAELVDFFAQLERLVANAQCDLVISFSEDAENVPESIR